MAYIDPNPITKPSLGNMETEFNAFVEKLPYDECTFTFYQMMDWELTNPIFIYWLPGGVGPEKMPYSLSITAYEESQLDYLDLLIKLLVKILL